MNRPVASIKGITTAMIRQREALVVRWASERQIPALFALAGGYQWGGLTLEAVAELHLENVRAFSERGSLKVRTEML